MPRARPPRGLGVRILIPLIAVAIGFVGYAQYSWFARSASVEIDGAYRAMNATVLQTMSREFQRYAPLLADLRGQTGASEASGAAVKALLEREYGLYGPAGTVPRLIASVGLSSLDRPESTSFLAPSGLWRAQASEFARPVPESAREQLADGALLVCDGESDENRLFILAPAGSGLLAVVEVDVDGFFETYTKPAVASALPDSQIEWSATARGGAQGRAAARAFPRAPGQEPARLSLDPLRAFLWGSSKELRTFSIVVPAAIDSFVNAGPGQLAAWAPAPPNDGSFRPLDGGRGPGPRDAFRMRSAAIVLSSGSAMGSLELRLALNWLLSTLLLAGIGLAFVLAVLQTRRLSDTRQRERDFVASVTHELRTPVTAIRSAADNMRRGLVGPERMRAYGEMIHGQALRLGSMIEEVLSFSKVEGGPPQRAPLAALCADELLAELRAPLDAIARSEGAALSWDFGALPEVFRCDAEVLRLGLSNLVANALYHAYEAGKFGEIRVRGGVSSRGLLRFEVEDDGRGIPKAEARLVFEAFYRGAASREQHEKGSGLGLFVSRRKAELAGGALTLESPYARGEGPRRPGCRFALELPFQAESDEA